jgi:hypothetical protein
MGLWQDSRDASGRSHPLVCMRLRRTRIPSGLRKVPSETSVEAVGPIDAERAERQASTNQATLIVSGEEEREPARWLL